MSKKCNCATPKNWAAYGPDIDPLGHPAYWLACNVTVRLKLRATRYKNSVSVYMYNLYITIIPSCAKYLPAAVRINSFSLGSSDAWTTASSASPTVSFKLEWYGTNKCKILQMYVIWTNVSLSLETTLKCIFQVFTIKKIVQHHMPCYIDCVLTI